MSAPARRINPLIPVGALVLALAGATYLSVEVVYRRRFSISEQEVTAALADFQSKFVPARFEISDQLGSQGFEHWREWSITPLDEVGRSGPHSGRFFEVRVSQARSWILQPPTITVYGVMGRDEHIEGVLDAALSARGLPHLRGFTLE